jgi:DNA invertase Pin-like site-specific DNA recombinase
VKSELVMSAHLARKAVVCIRQSTPHQVVSNQESLRPQYALRQRARELGWREADIDVIDSDLGLIGASTAQRSGFKELVGRVGLSEVGLILSIDVTRLARNCSDWYPLLDICGLRGCLIADRDGVYDPGSANGRLLLGLKGTISELELHRGPEPPDRRPSGQGWARRTRAHPSHRPGPRPERRCRQGSQS